MNRTIGIFLVGALGGGSATLLVLGLLGTGGLSSAVQSNDQTRIEARLDDFDARLRRIELNMGSPDAKDQRVMTSHP